MKTYKIYGILEKDMGHYMMTRTICPEAQAASEQDALDQFEVGGWEFQSGVAVEFVSKAVKIERARQPTLFALEDYK